MEAVLSLVVIYFVSHKLPRSELPLLASEIDIRFSADESPTSSLHEAK